MKDWDIEQLADYVIKGYSLKPPIALDLICREEGIEVAPGYYSTDFHGRIEFVPEAGIFIIYHPALDGNFPAGRVRFSISHELGHFYLEEHRNLIMQNRVHTSVGAFKPVSTRIEKEADKFASALLIPGETLDGLKGMRDYLTLGDILELSRICSSSAQAAAFRYICSTKEPCVAVVCNADRVEYAFASDEAAARGFQSLGNPFVPEKSAALRCLKTNPGEIIEGPSHTSYWFSERKYGSALWEESVRLGAKLFTLTMLSWPEYKG